MKILLAHGVLGFGRFAGLEYFNGVVQHLHDTFRGRVQVAIAQVDAIGSVQARADRLAAQIVAGSGGEKVHVFAHTWAVWTPGGLCPKTFTASESTWPGWS